MKRKALDSFRTERRKSREREQIEEIMLRTRVPSKWRLVDLETEEVWMWNPAKKHFLRAKGPTISITWR